MQFPGYFVSRNAKGAVAIEKCVFDETELTQASAWTEAHYNSIPDIEHWGGLDIDAAIAAAKYFLMKL